jgi:hypothetical protein
MKLDDIDVSRAHRIAAESTAGRTVRKLDPRFPRCSPC